MYYGSYSGFFLKNKRCKANSCNCPFKVRKMPWCPPMVVILACCGLQIASWPVANRHSIVSASYLAQNKNKNLRKDDHVYFLSFELALPSHPLSFMRWLQQDRKREEDWQIEETEMAIVVVLAGGGGGLIQAQRLEGKFCFFLLLEAFFCFRFPSVVQYTAHLQCGLPIMF